MPWTGCATSASAASGLLKQPGFTAAIVVVLALAIGATSGIFSAVYAVLLTPQQIDDPANLIVAWKTDRSRNSAVVELSYDDLLQWTLVLFGYGGSATDADDWAIDCVSPPGGAQPIRAKSRRDLCGRDGAGGVVPVPNRDE